MKIAQTQISANLETALMLVGQQHVELMQFALAQITEQIANVYRVLGENHLLHAQNVRSHHQFTIITIATLFSEKLHVGMFCVSVPPPTEPSLDVGCSTNDECPDYTACENKQCINPCAYKNPCAPTAHCRVVRHLPICTCPDGYVGSPTTSCQPRKKSYA